MLRSKIFELTVPPSDKSKQEKDKNFISVLKNQDIEGIQAYLNQENFDVNQPLACQELSNEGFKSIQRTPLEIVLRAERVNPEVLRALMDKGVKLELNQENYVNLAHAICQREKLVSKYEVIKTLSEGEEFVKQLKEKNPQDASTVLHLLAKDLMNQQEAIEFLVKEQGLNVNEPDNQGNTPFHVVECIDNAQTLMHVGADYRLKNKNQSTPLDVEIENQYSMSPEKIRHRQRISCGLFPITLGVIHHELKNKPDKPYQDIEKIFVENTKKENHPFFLDQDQQNSLGDRSVTSDQRLRIPLKQLVERLVERQRATVTCSKMVAEIAAQKSTPDPVSSEKKEKKSMLSRFFSCSAERKERKDPYAGYTVLSPTDEPHAPSEPSTSDQGKKAEDRARPSHSQ